VEFVLGETYTRKRIAEGFGGFSGGPFPAKDGKVVCGLVDLSTDAVTHLSGKIDVYPKSLSKAAKQLGKGDTLPLFLKISTQLWRYAGQFEISQIASSKAALAKAQKEIGREDIAAVLSFSPESPPLKLVKGRR
jgi:hypothetical protein